jgi:hypothetical protein
MNTVATGRGVVTPALGGEVASARAARDRGTVAFSVDGAAVAACAARPVENGVATCATTAPPSGAAHLVSATYSGGSLHHGSAGEGRFALKTPGAALPAAAGAGRVAVGASGTARVTLTSAGSAPLRVASVAVGLLRRDPARPSSPARPASSMSRSRRSRWVRRRPR